MNLYLIRGPDGLEGFVGQWWDTLEKANADVAELTRLFPDEGPYRVMEFVSKDSVSLDEPSVGMFIIKGPDGIYPGIWNSRGAAERDYEMVKCSGLVGNIIEVIPVLDIKMRIDAAIRLDRKRIIDEISRRVYYSPVKHQMTLHSLMGWLSDLAVEPIDLVALVEDYIGAHDDLPYSTEGGAQERKYKAFQAMRAAVETKVVRSVGDNIAESTATETACKIIDLEAVIEHQNRQIKRLTDDVAFHKSMSNNWSNTVNKVVNATHRRPLDTPRPMMGGCTLGVVEDVLALVAEIDRLKNQHDRLTT